TAEEIRAPGLKLAQVRHVLRGDLLNGFEFLEPVHAARFESENRLVQPRMIGEIAVAPEHAAADAVHQEQGRPRAMRLYFHQRRALALLSPTQSFGQASYRRFLKNRLQPKLLADLFFDCDNQLHCHKGMAAKAEEIIMDANRPDTKRLFPNRRELALQLRARRDHREMAVYFRQRGNQWLWRR